MTNNLNGTGLIFYLDNTTAREVCNWLTANWRRRKSASVWTWTPSYHHGRRYRATPLREATDGAGRVLLAAGIEEWETTHPAPLQVQDNPRALEILIIQADANLVQVEARCNAVLLLDSFTQLLRAAKVAYGGRLRNIAPAFGMMDAAPPGDAMMDAYIAARLGEFQELVIDLEPGFANWLGGPKRDDGAALNKLTRERLEYLRKDDNYRNKTDEELGIDMSLDADTVKKFRLKHGLRKRKERGQTKTPQTIPKQSP